MKRRHNQSKMKSVLSVPLVILHGRMGWLTGVLSSSALIFSYSGRKENNCICCFIRKSQEMCHGHISGLFSSLRSFIGEFDDLFSQEVLRTGDSSPWQPTKFFFLVVKNVIMIGHHD